jgi:hypothetical protein
LVLDEKTDIALNVNPVKVYPLVTVTLISSALPKIHPAIDLNPVAVTVGSMPLVTAGIKCIEVYIPISLGQVSIENVGPGCLTIRHHVPAYFVKRLPADGTFRIVVKEANIDICPTSVCQVERHVIS